jgi:hypothetical protein
VQSFFLGPPTKFFNIILLDLFKKLSVILNPYFHSLQENTKITTNNNFSISYQIFIILLIFLKFLLCTSRTNFTYKSGDSKRGP